MHDFTLSTDGGSRGNPGPSGAGAVIQDSSGAIVKEISKDLGTMTNNQAEYSALILGLEGLHQLGATGKNILVRMDSELIVQQVRGVYKVKNPGLKPLYDQAKELIDDLGSVSFVHVLRHLNKRADALVNTAIDKAQGVRP
jgi:ribonuclease HI